MPREAIQFPYDRPERLTFFIGPYGSGKSEVSVNYAFWLRRCGHAVTLCDLDIINPFFRSADARRQLEAEGIRLIAPVYAGTNVDVPAVPAEVYSVFDDLQYHAVLDIGGEEMGARVVATLRQRLVRSVSPPAVFLVINSCRPFSQTTEQIVHQAHQLARAAGRSPTALVHNANLLEESSGITLSDRLPILQAAANQLGIPVAFATAMAHLIPAEWGSRMPNGLPLLRMQRRIHYLRNSSYC